MQGSFLKKLGSGLRKNASRYSSILINSSFPVKQHVQVSVSLHDHIPSRSFSEKSTHEKVANYENLVASISNAADHQALVNVVSQNLPHFKNEHIVLTLRIFARLMKGPATAELQELVRNEQFRSLVAKAQESIERLNDYESLDLLFSIRKFRSNKLHIDFKEERLSALLEKINQYVKSKTFNFRNLVNLYYDLSFLNRYRGDVVNELVNEIRNDSKALTALSAIQLLQALSRNSNALGHKEYMLIDLLLRNLSNMMNEFDTDQKAHIFKLIATLNLQFSPPRYRIPYMLYTLRPQLKESFDTCSEKGVLYIVQAYKYLPKEYPTDLLNEIKEMVLLTIQHSNSSIKSYFLLEFFFAVSELKKSRRFAEEKWKTLMDEVANRITHDDFMGRYTNMQKILETLYELKIHHEPTLQAVVTKITQSPEVAFYGTLYELLVAQRVDVTPMLDKVLKSIPLEKMDPKSLTSLYAILTYIQNHKYDELEQQLLEKITSSSDLYRKGVWLSASYIKNNKTRDLILKAIHDLEAKYKQISDYDFFYNLSSMATYGTMDRALEFFEKNKDQLDEQHVSALIEVYIFMEELTAEKLYFFVQALQIVKEDAISVRKLLKVAKQNENFFTEGARNVANAVAYFSILVKHFDKIANEIKFQGLYPLALRADAQHLKIGPLNALLKKAFDKILENGFQPSDYIFVEYMIDNNLLAEGAIRQACDHFRDLSKDPNTRLKLLTALVKKNPKAVTEPAIEKELKELFSKIEGKLHDANVKTVLPALATLLSFPPTYVAENKDTLLKAFKEYIGFGNSQDYLRIIDSFSWEFVRTNYNAYSQFFKEITKSYTHFNKRFSISDILAILEKFSSIGYRNLSLYNLIIADLGANFNYLRSDEQARILQAFSKVSLRHDELFDKIFQRVFHAPYNYRENLRSIFDAGFRVGFDSALVKDEVAKFVELSKTERLDTTLALIQYLPILELKNEKELLDTLFSRVKGDGKVGDFGLLQTFFKTVYPDKPEYYETVKKFSYEPEFKPRNVERASALIASYLKVMKIECQEGAEFQGLKTDVVIPSKKAVLQVLTNRDLTIDLQHPRGQAILRKRIIEGLTGNTVILFNTLEFEKLTDHMSRINYLVSLGIETNNTTGVYDFSHIKSISEAIGEEDEEKAGTIDLEESRDQSTAQ